MNVRSSLVLVTGAGSGIGRATALAFSRRGARVLCADIVDGTAEKTAAVCAEVGAQDSAGFTVDVADAEAMRSLAERIHREHGVLDVLVNNAGVGMSGRFGDMTLDDWTWIRSINLDGVVHGCHAFGPAMVERGRGHVVNVSSGLAYTPRATEPAYVATKAAVLALSQSLRADWGPRGVGVSAICPGIIDTPIIDSTAFVGSGEDERETARTLFRRGHPPEKVAKAIVRAVANDRAVIPVGIEAWGGWFLHRFGPRRLQERVARQEISGLTSAGRPHVTIEPELSNSRPFAVQTDDGARIEGSIAGPDGAPTAVLAHCWTGTRAVWTPVAERLIEHGMRVVAYDHRGHGASTTGTDGSTLERLAADLSLVLHQTGTRDAILVGHSMGGMAIQTLAMIDPSVIAERVRAVVLVATSACGIGFRRVAGPAQRIVGSWVAQRVMSSPRGDRFARGAFGRAADRALVSQTRAMFAACEPASRKAFLEQMHTMDLRGLQRLDVPVTVIAGSRDRLTRPSCSREIAQRLGADLHVVADAGHMLPFEAPDATAARIADLRPR